LRRAWEEEEEEEEEEEGDEKEKGNIKRETMMRTMRSETQN
jgi:hypothetical protein